MTPPTGVAAEAVTRTAPASRAPAVRSLWSEAFRRFRKHHLATFGAVVLLVMVAAVMVGPFVYRVPIDEIDFRAKLKGPTWARICWPGCSTAAGSRSPSAWPRC